MQMLTEVMAVKNKIFDLLTHAGTYGARFLQCIFPELNKKTLNFLVVVWDLNENTLFELGAIKPRIFQ